MPVMPVAPVDAIAPPVDDMAEADVSVLLMAEAEVSVLVAIVPEVSVVLVVVVADVSLVTVVALVSVLVEVDSCLHAKPNRATAAIVRKTRIVFFIFFFPLIRALNFSGWG